MTCKLTKSNLFDSLNTNKHAKRKRNTNPTVVSTFNLDRCVIISFLFFHYVFLLHTFFFVRLCDFGVINKAQFAS